MIEQVLGIAGLKSVFFFIFRLRSFTHIAFLCLALLINYSKGKKVLKCWSSHIHKNFFSGALQGSFS